MPRRMITGRTWFSSDIEPMSRDLSVCTHNSGHYIVFLLAGVLVISWFVLTGDVRLKLMDEGYLWYDMHRTAHTDALFNR
jgi:hypothetical protein